MVSTIWLLLVFSAHPFIFASASTKKNIAERLNHVSERTNSSVILVYQKDCRSCDRLMLQIPCWQKNGIKLAAIGIGDKKLALRQKTRAYNLKPVLLSFGEARASGFNQTPLLFAKAKKHGEWRVLAAEKVTCQKLSSYLN